MTGCYPSHAQALRAPASHVRLQFGLGVLVMLLLAAAYRRFASSAPPSALGPGVLVREAHLDRTHAHPSRNHTHARYFGRQRREVVG